MFALLHVNSSEHPGHLHDWFLDAIHQSLPPGIELLEQYQQTFACQVELDPDAMTLVRDDLTLSNRSGNQNVVRRWVATRRPVHSPPGKFVQGWRAGQALVRSGHAARETPE